MKPNFKNIDIYAGFKPVNVQTLTEKKSVMPLI